MTSGANGESVSVFSRDRHAYQRYGRNKVIATLVTFAVVWVAVKWVYPGVGDAISGLALRTPGLAFRERLTGEPVQTTAVVEVVLADSTDAEGVLVRHRLRTMKDHPFTLLEASPGMGAGVGDTVRVRGVYVWDLTGGSVDVRIEGAWLKDFP